MLFSYHIENPIERPLSSACDCAIGSNQDALQALALKVLDQSSLLAQGTSIHFGWIPLSRMVLIFRYFDRRSRIALYCRTPACFSLHTRVRGVVKGDLVERGLCFFQPKSIPYDQVFPVSAGTGVVDPSMTTIGCISLAARAAVSETSAHGLAVMIGSTSSDEPFVVELQYLSIVRPMNRNKIL